MQDADGRRESGQGLAESEERYRLISEVISDYTFSTKLNAEGKLFLNWVAGAFEAITGYTYEEYVDKMQRLLSELLQLSRVGRVFHAAQAVLLGLLAREAASLVGGQLRDHRVALTIADDLPSVWGDRARLLEVLQNLLDNAAKFMDDQEQPRVEIGVRRGAGERVLFVRDNGKGIDARFHDRVFGLFEKLDPDSEGSGVGLALVKRIVDLHHGRVWVESDGAGQGTTVCFTLPEAPASAGAASRL